MSSVAHWLVGRSDSEPTAYRGSEFDLFRKEIPNFWGPFYARRLGRPAIKVAILGIWAANLLLGLAMVVHALSSCRKGRARPPTPMQAVACQPSSPAAEAEAQDLARSARGVGGGVGWAAGRGRAIELGANRLAATESR